MKKFSLCSFLLQYFIVKCMLIFSDKNPLDIFSSGDEVYKTNGKDLIEDSIRRMTEECDYLQVRFYFLKIQLVIG